MSTGIFTIESIHSALRAGIKISQGFFKIKKK